MPGLSALYIAYRDLYNHLSSDDSSGSSSDDSDDIRNVRFKENQIKKLQAIQKEGIMTNVTTDIRQDMTR